MPRALVWLGALLALGLLGGAWVLGIEAGHLGGPRATVSVKGLAEKPVQADTAEWQVRATAVAPTIDQALARLATEKASLDRFLDAQGIERGWRHDEPRSVGEHKVTKELPTRTVEVDDGFEASQAIRVSTPALDRVTAVNGAALDYKAAGHSIDIGEPMYLVSDLERIKMSLLAAATQDAARRAAELIRFSPEARLGSLRSASQGAFYILPEGGEVKSDDYGGTYDKSTVKKIARVVVTVEFNLR